MIFNVKIAENVIDNVSNINIVETQDQSYDYGQMVIFKNPNADCFPIVGLVEIQKVDSSGTETDYMLISADTVKTVNKDLSNIYRHEIPLVELTRRMDQFVVSDKVFSQNKTLRQTLTDLFNSYMVFKDENDISRRIPILLFSSTLNPLNDIKARDYYFTNATLTEAVEAIMIEAGGFPKITYDGFVFSLEMTILNKKNNLISLADRLDYQQQQSIDRYVTTLDSNISNAVYEKSEAGASIVEPSQTGFMGVRTQTEVFNSNNSVFITQFPIYQLVKAEMNIALLGGATKTTIDITKRVVDEEILQDLKLTNSFNVECTGGFPYSFEAEPVNGTVDPQLNVYDKATRRGVIFFKRGTNIIQGLYTEYGVIFTTTVMRTLMLSAIWDTFGPEICSNFLLTGNEAIFDFENLEFRIEYIPTFNSRFQVERDRLDVINKVSTAIVNQGAKTTSAERALEINKLNLQALGTRDISILRRHKLLNEKLELGDYTTNNYILSVKESDYHKDFYDVKYKFDKNFQKTSPDVSVDSKQQIFAIPNDVDTIERKLIYKEYVEWDTIQDDGEITRIQSIGKSIYMNLFIRNFDFNRKVNNCIINNPNKTDWYNLGVASFGGGGVINLQWKIDSPLVIGEQLDLTSETIPTLNPIAYADEDGAMEEINMIYTNDVEITDFRELPIINRFNIDESIVVADDVLQILKDPFETLSFNYQLHSIARNPRIIIGDYFITRNNLIEKIFSYKTLSVWESQEVYGENENRTVKGTERTDITITATANRVAISKFISLNAWAIGTEDGDLLIAVNQNDQGSGISSISEIHPNYKDKRSDEDYGF